VPRTLLEGHHDRAERKPRGAQPGGSAGDLARTHRAAGGGDRGVEHAQIQADLAALERDGYVILTGLLSRKECDHLRAELTPLLGHIGRNAFEGHRTQRIYSVLNKTRSVDRLGDHPRVLALLDRLLLPNYLLSQLQVINIRPGEDTQLLHPDDGFYPVTRPPAGAVGDHHLGD
jgi:hypothetical protein